MYIHEYDHMTYPMAKRNAMLFMNNCRTLNLQKTGIGDRIYRMILSVQATICNFCMCIFALLTLILNPI
jgi:hypothetical protein